MELDQNIFSFLLRFKKKRKVAAFEKRKELLNAVELHSVKESLAIFASAIFHLPIEIRESSDYPYKSGNKLFLPSFFAISDNFLENEMAYHVLILNLYATSLEFSPLPSPLTLFEELNKINEVISKSINLLKKLYPNYENKYNLLTKSWSDVQKRNIVLSKESFEKEENVGFDPMAIWGRLPRLANFIEGSSNGPEVREAMPEGATEKKSKSRGQVKKINLEEGKENIAQDVFHHFEKVETVEEYKGIQRDTDGADELAAHAEALDDLNLEEVVRTSNSAKSLYKTELDMGFEIADLKDKIIAEYTKKVFFYDEWDEKNRNYKKDWCRVFHTNGVIPPDSTIKNKTLMTCLKERHVEVTKLKKKLIQLTTEVCIEKKLLNGPNIDIDNVIRNACLRKNGDSGDQRYYQESKKRHRDMACILLVDTSLSSDSWVQNKRILDVSLEALLIFGEASKDLGDPIMIAGFNSNTRHDCKFIEWKSFEAPWTKFTSQVDHIVPSGYTRIGPAIRHATKILADRKERHKLLMIFTDGRPTDFDRYEGHYGLSDVRQAIKESDTAGVVAFALAIDPTAKQFLPKLFGLGNFQVLMNLESMPLMLTKLYARMSRRK